MTVKKGAYMYIKWMVPDYGMRGILNGIGRFLFGENDEVHYIGGAEVLPPPLAIASFSSSEACASGCLPQMRRRRRGEN